VFETAQVIGRGRVGSAIAARLAERGVELLRGGAELVLLCVPDGEIAGAAAAVEPGPWVAHVSGATRPSALEPHERRFSVHPLQTFVRSRGPEQLDGAFAAVSGETPEAVQCGFALARTLGLAPFELDDSKRPAYHAGAAFASAYLVTLHRAAAQLLRYAGAPPEALLPLMARTMENGFEPTGPAVRSDWTTIAAHLEAIRTAAPALEELYRALAGAEGAVL
jgi:predicted short-subunit dehydrogenase-like oxidoreductase (DUF2520 family)